jgi:outer membrane protein assembly factor BamB
MLFIALCTLANGAAQAASISLSDRSLPPTRKVTISGSGFASGDAISLAFDDATLASASADGGGAFSGTSLAVPATATPGEHTIVATGRSGRSAQATLRVGAEWRQSGYSGGHTHANPYENLINSGNVASLAPLWEAQVGGVQGTFFSPVTASGYVFFSGSHNLYALHDGNGAGHWHVAMQPFGVPAIAGNAIAVVAYNSDGTAELMAFGVKDGASLWSVSVSPLGEIAADSDSFYTSTGKVVSAYAAASGALRWQAALPGCTYFSPASGPIVASGGVYVGCYNGVVLKLDTSSGAVLWSAPVGPIDHSPAMQGTMVYVSDENGVLYALDAADGTRRWTAQLDSKNFYFAPAVAGGIVYQLSNAHTLYAFNKTSGKQLWAIADAGDTNPAIANGIVYLAKNGGLQAYDAISGALIAAPPYVQAGAVIGDPVVVNGQLYLVDNAAGTVILRAYSLPSP